MTATMFAHCALAVYSTTYSGATVPLASNIRTTLWLLPGAYPERHRKCRFGLLQLCVLRGLFEALAPPGAS